MKTTGRPDEEVTKSMVSSFYQNKQQVTAIRLSHQRITNHITFNLRSC